MSDPHEDERRDRFERPMEPMLMILDEIRVKLVRVKEARNGGVAMELYDEAMDSLFKLLNLCKPLAFRVEKRGQQAFMWVEDSGQPTAVFRWMVCLSDGSCRQGSESSQRNCETAVEKHLQ